MSISFEWGNSNVHTDLIKALTSKGHCVTVVTCNSKDNQNEYYSVNQNLNILNVMTGNQFDRNLIKKGINMITLQHKMISSIKHRLANNEFNLVLYSTPPITFSSVVKFCKKKYNCKSYLALKDIFPQNAVDLKMFRSNSLIYKYFRNKEVDLYRISDKIGCMSQGNVEYLLQHNESISIEKVEIFPNAHLVKPFENRPKEDEIFLTFIFGGNLGKPQAIPNLLKIIENLKDYTLARFIIVGKGSSDKLIKDYLKTHNGENLIYKDFLPKKEYDEVVQNADIGIISLNPNFTIPNIPSKTLNYMELGKPILALTDNVTDIRNIIEEANCGWWCCSDNVEGSISLIKSICNERKDLITKGKNGRKYFEEKFDAYKNVEILERFLEEE